MPWLAGWTPCTAQSLRRSMPAWSTCWQALVSAMITLDNDHRLLWPVATCLLPCAVSRQQAMVRAASLCSQGKCTTRVLNQPAVGYIACRVVGMNVQVLLCLDVLPLCSRMQQIHAWLHG